MVSLSNTEKHLKTIYILHQWEKYLPLEILISTSKEGMLVLAPTSFLCFQYFMDVIIYAQFLV